MITIKWLSSGYVRLQGPGPSEWAQVPRWPCDEMTLSDGTFFEASDYFRSQCLAALNAERLRSAQSITHVWTDKLGDRWSPDALTDLCVICGKTPDAHPVEQK